MFRSFKKSEERASLIIRWILTAVVLGFMVRVVAPTVAEGGYGGAFGGIPLAAVSGLVLAIIWRHSIASIIAQPFGDLYDGGSEPVTPRPLYSAAQAQRKLGHYDQAIAKIRAELAKFPNDFEGQLMIAEIQAENLHDLSAADLTVQRLLNQPGHAPQNIALALNSMADWQLKYVKDHEAARQCLEKIIELLPDSEMAALAAQRIAHLAGAEELQDDRDRKKFSVTPGAEDIGLLAAEHHPKAPEMDPGRQAAEYVKHLTAHPLDTEAREKLALIYANHFGRLDLAADQLEEMIALPNQPMKRVAGWLNLLAHLQIEFSANYDTVRATLQRIVELFPGTAPAAVAARRIENLKLEIKGKTKSQAVKLGSYEQDIGLRSGPPRKD